MHVRQNCVGSQILGMFTTLASEEYHSGCYCMLLASPIYSYGVVCHVFVCHDGWHNFGSGHSCQWVTFWICSSLGHPTGNGRQIRNPYNWTNKLPYCVTSRTLSIYCQEHILVPRQRVILTSKFVSNHKLVHITSFDKIILILPPAAY